MKKYNDMVNYAYSLVEITEKMYEQGNEMAYFMLLVGVGNSKVSITPDQSHNYQAVIDAIHLYQKNHLNKPVNKGYYEGILMGLSLLHTEKAIQNIINIINYELKKEKEGTNSFELDMKNILQQFRIEIQRVYNDFKSNNENFENWINGQNKYMSENYGHKIL